MIRGKIESIAFGGSGILRHDGLVIFVPFTAVGDTVQVDILQKKKNHAFGKLICVEDPSPLRTTPHCSYFGICGGCQLQHLTYAAQLETKRLFIEESLKRIGKLDISVPPVVPSAEQWAYRCHIKLGLKPQAKGFTVGYMKQDGISLLPITHCPIFHADHDPIINDVRTCVASLSSEGIENASLRIFKNQDRYLLAASFAPHLPSNHQECFKNWAGGIILRASDGQEVHYGDTSAQLEIDGLCVDYSPYGFLQNHPEQSKNLYRALVKSVPAEAKTVLDLYCGIGISSLLIAQNNHEVIGVEIDQESIDLAKKNADRNGVSHAEFIQGDAEVAAQTLLNLHNPACVVLNPPRTGLTKTLIEYLTASKTEHLSYVSCMPSTLARDLNLLSEGGFQIRSIQGFDMFPQTTHVETLVQLNRR